MNTTIPALVGIHNGKVRHTWMFSDNTRLIETSDRISAFDVVLPFDIPQKGIYLHAISQNFFQLTKSILENHFLDSLGERLMLARSTHALPIEIIVRGYLCGSLWRAYRKDINACNKTFGCKLSMGLIENAPLPEPLVTFTTKTTHGHDEIIDSKQTKQHLDSWLKTLAIHSTTANILFENILAKAKILFEFGRDYSKKRDLILVDTKFEMGLDLKTHNLILIDECFTPDSSRYWPYNSRTPLSKELLRERLLAEFGEQALNANDGAWAASLQQNTAFQKNLVNELQTTYQQIFDALLSGVANQKPSPAAAKKLNDLKYTALRQQTLFPENVLIVGNGGREHAIYNILSNTQHEIKNIYCLPGNRSWGLGIEKPLSKEIFFKTVADHKIGFVIIGPEEALANGVADWCAEALVPVLGPSAAAARLESSKWFCKQMAITADVPTPHATLHSLDELKTQQFDPMFPCVLKFDGLAAGKGVFVVHTRDEFNHAVLQLSSFCPEPDKKNILLEDCILGHECSAIALCNETSFRMLPFARDYKRRFDNDNGPNTGGMGAYAPLDVGEPIAKQMHAAIERLLAVMKENKLTFYGFLFCGFMIDPRTKKTWLIECNTRLGDPEAEVLLPSLDGNEFLAECLQIANRKPFLFSSRTMRSDGKKRVYVVGTTDEYPAFAGGTRYKVDVSTILGKPNVINHSVNMLGECLGGRVLGCLGVGDTFVEAQQQAYETLHHIKFFKNDAPHSIACRSDIGLSETTPFGNKQC